MAGGVYVMPAANLSSTLHIPFKEHERKVRFYENH
jgi:hypothetical protein